MTGTDDGGSGDPDAFRQRLREASPDRAARIILGGVLSHGPVSVQIVEVEAYGGPPDSDHPDSAAHTWPGPTARNEVMFGDAGHLYVYLSHGIHRCVNITCRPAGQGGGILLRAGRVVSGNEVVAERRPGVAPRQWARGPGNLGRTLAIDLEHRGTDLLTPVPTPQVLSSSSILPTITFRPDPVPGDQIRTGPRVGVSREADRAWRFWIAGAPEVSGYRRSPRAPAVTRPWATSGPMGDNGPRDQQHPR